MTKEDRIMDKIWTIMAWIANGFRLFGFAIIALWVTTMIFNTGNKTVDKIRNYMLMIDEEDLE